MKNLFIICILFWNLTGITVATPDKAQVMELLEGRHWKLDVESFQLLGVDTDKVLIEIGGDPSFRAIDALSLFPTENTASFLELYAEKSFAPLARRGFEALKNGFYKTQPQRVKRLAARLLKHPNAHVRISAARFMRSVDAPRFKRFLKSESDSWVRKEAQK
jgi:hypothetical protein